MSTVYDLIVIGGGAAGMMCAYTAAERGLSVTLLDPNNQLGRKVRITGKGRCNVTNNCDLDTLIANTPKNGRFLYSAFSAFNSQDTMEFFEKRGTPLKTERGNRVFPVSDKAKDIVNALVTVCTEDCEHGVAHCIACGSFCRSSRCSIWQGRSPLRIWKPLPPIVLTRISSTPD